MRVSLKFPVELPIGNEVPLSPRSSPIRRAPVLAALAASAAFATPALSVDVKPLPSREGVVLAWDAKAKTALVVTRGNQRVYVIHTLRKYKPGTRVRVDGVKWGTPTSGVKWAKRPAGIKWGIKWARSGVFASRLTVIPGRLQTATLRGGRVVRRFGTKGVAVSYPGATFVVKVSRRAVWLPGGKITSATGGIGDIGSTVDLRVAIGPKGGILASRVTQKAPAVAGAALPLAGTVVAADLTLRSLTIRSSTDPAFPVDTIVTVPVGVDLNRYPVGAAIAANVVPSPTDPTVAYAADLALNTSFEAADAVATTVTVPVPSVPHLASADDMRTKWAAGNAAGLIARHGFFMSESNRLDRVKQFIVVGDRAGAIAELVRFEDRLVDCANEPGGGSGNAIDPTFAAEMVTLSKALRAALSA